MGTAYCNLGGDSALHDSLAGHGLILIEDFSDFFSKDFSL